jgi:hypothetical protein
MQFLQLIWLTLSGCFSPKMLIIHFSGYHPNRVKVRLCDSGNFTIRLIIRWLGENISISISQFDSWEKSRSIVYMQYFHKRAESKKMGSLFSSDLGRFCRHWWTKKCEQTLSKKVPFMNAFCSSFKRFSFFHSFWDGRTNYRTIGQTTIDSSISIVENNINRWFR